MTKTSAAKKSPPIDREAPELKPVNDAGPGAPPVPAPEPSEPSMPTAENAPPCLFKPGTGITTTAPGWRMYSRPVVAPLGNRTRSLWILRKLPS